MGSKRRRGAASAAAGDEPLPKHTVNASASSSSTTASKPLERAQLAAKKLKVIQSGTAVAAPVSASSSKKKKKKSKSAAVAPSTVAPSTKPNAPTTTRAAAEIDDLFASLKTKKQAQIEADAAQQRMAQQALAAQRKEQKRLDEQIKLLESQNTNSTASTGMNPEARPVRYDDDGLPIYTEASLKINEGGDTADCPFDCWCCF